MSVGVLVKLTCLLTKSQLTASLLHDVVGDVVQDRQIGLRLEDHAMVGQFEAAMLEGRQHVDLGARLGQAGIGQARPQDRVHLGHVRAPQHERIGVLEVVVAAHRLVCAEGADEGADRRRHAVACVRVDVVGAETGLVQLRCRIAFEYGPLTGTEHADAGGQLFRGQPLVALEIILDRGLPLLGHDVEGLVPGDRFEIAFLVELAVLLAQQRLGDTVLAVHDLGQEIALDAVQATVDRRIRIALGGDHAVTLGTHEYRTAGAAETAGRLVPANVLVLLGSNGLDTGDGDAGSGGGGSDGIGLDEFTACLFHCNGSSGDSSFSIWW